MRFRFRALFCLSLSLGLLLSACGPLTHKDAVKDLDQQIEVERKRQELERLKSQNQPSPAPTATSSPEPFRPNAGNQPPRLTRLEARLRTTVKNNDTVELVAEANDPDGDSLEYTWASVYSGLSATRGQQAVWFPNNQSLNGRTNLLTLTVSDKKGGTSTGTLNVFIQADGTLLVRENLAAQPVLLELEIIQPDPGQLRFKARATDPAGGTVRYKWSASKGLLGSTSTDTATWTGSEPGEVLIQLLMTNGDGTAQNQLEYRFVRNPDGSLSGDFRTIRGAAPIVAPPPTPGSSASTTDGINLQGTLYGTRNGSLVSASLATGQLLELSKLTGSGGVGEPNQMLYDGVDQIYLLGNSVSALSLARLDISPVSLPNPVNSPARRLFKLQGQACVVTGSNNSYTAYQLASGQALMLKHPEWLLNGEISSQGLVASLQQRTVQVSDPGRGVQQAWLDLSNNQAVMAWQPDGTRLAVISGNDLHLLGTDGSKAVKKITRQPAKLFWLNGSTLLAIQGQPGNYEAWALNPDTGGEQALNASVAAAIKNLKVLEPG